MRKRLLNESDDDVEEEEGTEKQPLTKRAMKVIQLKPKVKVVAVIIFILSGIILLMNLPIFSSHTVDEFEIPDVEHIVKNERYVSTGSLKFKNRQFLLDGEPFRFMSGAVHYFRIPEAYWEDILKKAKAAGLNTIDTYVPWNLHEDRPGIYYFATYLNLQKFLSTAHKLGLYVILRPGPYICSEWDFGGLPGWLLKNPEMKVRTNYKPYMEAVDKWFETLFSKIKTYQYSSGGPIIAVQVENEFGSFSSEHEHLSFIKETMIKHGVKEMFLTSDGVSYGNKLGTNVAPFYQHSLPTANFQNFNQGKKIFDHIKSLSKDFPLAVMEFWAGWFDHWGEKHEVKSASAILKNFEQILETGASVSIYMFHGGTNFGFMAGANYFEHSNYHPDITSYDYGAPISEAGDTTPLYRGMRDLIYKYTGVQPPPVPPNREKAAYGKVEMMTFMSWDDLLGSITKDVKVYRKVQPMEYLNMKEQRDGYGQNYGYIVYRRTVPLFTKLKILGRMEDRLQIVVDGRRHSQVLDWKSQLYNIDVSSLNLKEGNHTLDILVENLGRVNYVVKGSNVLNQQRKGLIGDVVLDDAQVNDWTIYPLTFSKRFTTGISVHDSYKPLSSLAKPPCLFRTDLKIEGPPKDTFLSMEGWGKGTVFINGFHLGRYWNIGPQKTLFVPAPYLKQKNLILVFEEQKKGDNINFIDHPVLS